FSSTGSSIFNFLDAAGAAPERIEGDPSGPGQAQANRARGSTMSSVTIDLAGVHAMVDQQINAPDSPMRAPKATALRIEALQRQIAAARAGGRGPLIDALGTTERNLAQQSTQLLAARHAVFDQMRAVAANAGGMRSDADLTPIRTAVAAVETMNNQ